MGRRKVAPPPIISGGFKIEIQTTSDGQSFTLPLVNPATIVSIEGGVAADYGYDCVVDWGDGDNNIIQAYNDANITHSYETAGTYTIEIKGQCDGWSFNYSGSRLLIKKILSWGDKGFKGFRYLYAGFYGCVNLTELPAEQGIKCRIRLSDLSLCFQACPITSIPEDLFKYIIDAKNFKGCFARCPITSIPENLFKYNVNVENFSECFYVCPITSIPENLFKYNVNVEDFSTCFISCPITSIPENLFKYNVNVKTFRQCFQSCSITSIPENLFKYNVNVETFGYCFYGSLITSIPANLFKYNINAVSFELCFRACRITSIPANLFKYNINAVNFSRCFAECDGLTLLPSDLFKYNVNAYDFYMCFYMCYNLQLRSDMFDFANFLNKNMDFFECFRRTFFEGVQGTAPALWEADYGTGAPTRTQCFGGGGNSATSLTNYADIPTEWK